MRTADKWADSKDVGGGTVQSKKAEREELQRDVEAFLKAGGEVKEADEKAKTEDPGKQFKKWRDRAIKKNKEQQ